MAYTSLIRPILFSVDPEDAHKIAMKISTTALRVGPIKALVKRVHQHRDPRLEKTLFGLRFPNPVGLAAGFDKDCEGFDLLSSLGFGHIEIGTVTAVPQRGNPRPRIFRFPEKEALINRMGFPSAGCEAVAPRLAEVFAKRKDVIVGINIGKSKVTPLDEAEEDYRTSFRALSPYADYVVVNVSSPNTPELRKLQEKDRLGALFKGLAAENPRGLPILVKVSPDLSESELEDVISVIRENRIAGVIATNTTISRDTLPEGREVQGGVSGAPVRERSLSVVARLYRELGQETPIIGVGGIFSSEDALRMIAAGATLLQVYTGFIYRGPSLVKDINRGISKYLDQHSLSSLDPLVGSEASRY